MADAPTEQVLDTRVEKVRLGDLKLLKLNARHMTHSQFARLVANVKRDGGLTSVPFGWIQEDGEYLVLSGNHRVRAAIEAFGPDHEAYVMLCDTPMPKDRATALQLAHNSIAGEDDVAVLKELYESLENVDERLYAGLDDKTLELLDKVELGSLNEASLAFQTTTVVFLPEEALLAEAAMDEAAKEIGSAPDAVWLARYAEWDRLVEALDLSGKSWDVRNVATSLMVILDIFQAHVTDLEKGFINGFDEIPDDRKAWIPLEVLFGSSEVPPGAAQTIRLAVKRMKKAGDLDDTSLWRAIELWAADYLAGSHDG
jgi:hypothetical protein